jgi:hypothetical protein
MLINGRLTSKFESKFIGKKLDKKLNFILKHLYHLAEKDHPEKCSHFKNEYPRIFQGFLVRLLGFTGIKFDVGISFDYET